MNNDENQFNNTLARRPVNRNGRTIDYSKKPVARNAGRKTKQIDKVKAVQKHRPFKLQDVMNARATINEAFERASNISDDSDKLTILKTGYMLALQNVPNVTKPKKQWHVFDAEDYQYEIEDKRIINMYKVHPNMALERALKARQIDLNKFWAYSLKHGVAYVDDLILLDENYHSLTGIDITRFAHYILPYKTYLQQEFLRLNKRNSNQLMNEINSD